MSGFQMVARSSLTEISDGQISSQDLRSKLARPNLRIVRLRKGGSSLGVMDLREKLSGSTSQRPPVSQAQGGAELQRRLTSVVRNSSNGAQTAPRAPAPLLKQTASVTRTPAAVSFLLTPFCWKFFCKSSTLIDLALVSYWPHGRSDAHVVDHKGALLQWASCFASYFFPTPRKGRWALATSIKDHCIQTMLHLIFYS